MILLRFRNAVFIATQYVLEHLYLDPALQKNIQYGYYQAGTWSICTGGAGEIPRRLRLYAPGSGKSLMRKRRSCSRQSCSARWLCAAGAVVRTHFCRDASARLLSRAGDSRRLRRRRDAPEHPVGGRTLAYTARPGTSAAKPGGPTDVPDVFRHSRSTIASARRPRDVLLQRRPGQLDHLVRMGSFGPMRVIVGQHGTSTPTLR